MKAAVPLHTCGIVVDEPDLVAVSDADVSAWIDYDTIMTAEAPEVPVEVHRYRVRNMPDGLRLRLFVAREPGGAIVGDGRAIASSAPRQQHLSQVHVSVRPDWRRRGIGRALMACVLEAAAAEHRTVLTGWSCDRTPGSEPFARRLGAEAALTHCVNRLLIADLDRPHLLACVAQGARHAADYELVTADGPYPDALIDVIAALRGTIETVTPGGIDMMPAAMTAADIRESDRGVGGRRWTLAARHTRSGEIVAITEVWFPSNQPWMLKQLSTVVHPAHRGRGLGKWLKAAMLRRVIDERPAVREIRTANFASNAPIAGINRALGFTTFMVSTGWRAPADVVRAHLADGPRAS